MKSKHLDFSVFSAQRFFWGNKRKYFTHYTGPNRKGNKTKSYFSKDEYLLNGCILNFCLIWIVTRFFFVKQFYSSTFNNFTSFLSFQFKVLREVSLERGLCKFFWFFFSQCLPRVAGVNFRAKNLKKAQTDKQSCVESTVSVLVNFCSIFST